MPNKTVNQLCARLRELRADIKIEERTHEESMDRYHRIERELIYLIGRAQNLPRQVADEVPSGSANGQGTDAQQD